MFGGIPANSISVDVLVHSKEWNPNQWLFSSVCVFLFLFSSWSVFLGRVV